MSNKRNNDFNRIEKRRKEAAERITARLERSPEAQLKILNSRVGKKGAQKERARLES